MKYCEKWHAQAPKNRNFLRGISPNPPDGLNLHCLINVLFGVYSCSEKMYAMPLFNELEYINIPDCNFALRHRNTWTLIHFESWICLFTQKHIHFSKQQLLFIWMEVKLPAICMVCILFIFDFTIWGPCKYKHIRYTNSTYVNFYLCWRVIIWLLCFIHCSLKIFFMTGKYNMPLLHTEWPYIYLIGFLSFPIVGSLLMKYIVMR